MTIAQIIRLVAWSHGISVAQCRSEMMAAIQEAWSTTNPETRQLQLDLVGDDHTPTPEELIFLISEICT